MWFGPSRDPKQFFKALLHLGKWLIFGPVFGAVVLGLIGLFVNGVEGMINGAAFGAAFGAMGGVMVAGSVALANLDR